MEEFFNKLFRTRRTLGIIGTIIFFVIFLGMIGVFIFLATASPNYEEQGYLLLNASVTHISSDTIYVTFNLGGDYFNAPLNYYDGSIDLGTQYEVYVNPSDLSMVYMKDMPIISMIVPFVGIAAIAIAFGAIAFISYKKRGSRLVQDPTNFKSQPSSSASVDSVDGVYPSYDSIKKFDPDAINESSVDGSKGYFHFNKSYNSLSFEDSNGSLIGSITKISTNILKGSEFEFKNVLTGSRYVRRIGMTTSTEIDGVTTNSSFKIDGVKAEDYIQKMGLSIVSTKVSYFGCEYDLMKNGEKIASVHPSSKAPGAKFANKLGFKSVGINGYYDVDYNEDNIDDVLLCLFILSRVQQVGL